MLKSLIKFRLYIPLYPNSLVMFFRHFQFFQISSSLKICLKPVVILHFPENLLLMHYQRPFLFKSYHKISLNSLIQYFFCKTILWCSNNCQILPENSSDTCKISIHHVETLISPRIYHFSLNISSQIF